MKIEKTEDSGKLSLKVTGRLDTTTAPELEETLKNSLEGVSFLVFDFSSLEYISSAGLRVLLAAHKAMKAQEGETVVRGANEEVCQVFTITGFSEILTVEDQGGLSRKGVKNNGAKRNVDEQTGGQSDPAAAAVQRGRRGGNDSLYQRRIW